jgi:hypothetical protein
MQQKMEHVKGNLILQSHCSFPFKHVYMHSEHFRITKRTFKKIPPSSFSAAFIPLCPMLLSKSITYWFPAVPSTICLCCEVVVLGYYLNSWLLQSWYQCHSLLKC